MGDVVSDSELVRRSRAEPRVFEQLFERHFDELYRYLAHRTNPSVAEDLAAETFTIAFAKRASYAAFGDSAKPWLFAIATNLIRARYRTERRGLSVLSRLAGREPRSVAAAELDLDARGDARDERGRLWAALGDIRRQEREVLLLFAWADLSYAEIAVVCDCPIGTVRSRIARARVALSRSLANLDPSHPGDPVTIEVPNDCA
jgi:RNA polymerase sigma factor (sigma-70 family)